MESTKKNSPHRICRVTGILFLLILIGPLFNWLFIISKIISDQAQETVDNILNNEILFRLSISLDLVTTFVVLGLGISLYILLHNENKYLGLSALILKIFEALLWSVITLGNFIILLLIKEISSADIAAHDQFITVIGSFLKVHVPVTAFSGVFLGLSMILFLYLLLKSSFVPKILARFGIFSYLLIFIYDMMVILSPAFSNMMIQLTFALPSIIFELVIGYWLIFKVATKLKNRKNENS